MQPSPAEYLRRPSLWMFGMGTAAMVWTLGTGEGLLLRGVIESPPRAATSLPGAVEAIPPEAAPTARLTFVAADGEGEPEPPRPVEDSRSPPIPSIQPVVFESDGRPVSTGRRPAPAVLTGRIELLPPSR